MNPLRVIPRLDIKAPNLVKGIHLEGLRVMGNPAEFAKFYERHGADELLYMDIVASLYERNSLLDMIQKTSQEIFIPLTVGGGLRSLEDIQKVLHAGADKVALNTAAIRNPSFITEAAQRFGASTILISIEAIQKEDGSYEAYTDNGREKTGKEVIAWAKEAEERGAGEVMITSIDREGTGGGYDIELTQAITSILSIPVIACGGAGKKEDVCEVAKQGQVNGVAVASLFHYDFLSRYSEKQEQIGLIGTQTSSSRIQSCSVTELKKMLIHSGVSCRPPQKTDYSIEELFHV